jgi:micrococcal nuclease
MRYPGGLREGLLPACLVTLAFVAGACTADPAPPAEVVAPQSTEHADPLPPPEAPAEPTVPPEAGDVVEVVDDAIDVPPVVAGELPAGDDVTVERIIDGDTIVVTAGERIRLIGIDTPETVHPSKPVECFGPEASAHLASLIPPGTEVRLVYDVERLDRFGRTLAYVWRTDGLDVNAAMVADGYASVYTVPPNVARQEDFLSAQRRAREQDLGLWGADCAAPDIPAPVPPPPAASATQGCDPAYPDVCIPPAPPDLNCGDIPHRRFRVLAPDPHNFDGDGDGIGCQS